MFDYTKYRKEYESETLVAYKRNFGKYYINLCVGPRFSDPGIFQDIYLYNTLQLEIVRYDKYRTLISYNEIKEIGLDNIINKYNIQYNSSDKNSSFIKVKLDLIEKIERFLKLYMVFQ